MLYGDYIASIAEIITRTILTANVGITAMIIFDKLRILMKKKGLSTYTLREKCRIDSKTIRRLFG